VSERIRAKEGERVRGRGGSERILLGRILNINSNISLPGAPGRWVGSAEGGGGEGRG
jgi:hypothetical protein